MKRVLSIVMVSSFFVVTLFPQLTKGQCTGGTLNGTMNTPTGTTQTVVAQVGFYKTFTATANETYLFSFCAADGGTADFDTKITILDDTGNPSPGGYNDDYCSFLSRVVWTAPSNATYRVLLSEYVSSSDICNNTLTSSGTMAYKTTTELATQPDYQPSDFTYSSETSTSFNYNFEHSDPAVTGYLHLMKAGSAPTFTPVDGVVYTPNTEPVTGTKILYSDNFPNGQPTGLTSGTTYYIAIYAYNGSGTSRNYLTTSPLTGTVSTTGALATEPSAQPTNFNESNITLTSFTINFNTAPGASGYIGIANPTTAPTFVPVDGTAYSQGQPVGSNGDFVSFPNANPPINVTGANPGTTLQFKIYSLNGTGSATNYLTSSPLPGSVTTLQVDGDPPDVTDNTPKTVEKGSPVTISVNATDLSDISYIYANYAKNEDFDEDDIGYVDLNLNSGNTYTGTIPASAVGDMGLIYAITAYDEFDNYYTDADVKIITVTVDGSGVTIPYSGAGTEQSNYRIVSVPLVLEKKSVNDVFGDDLGEYGDKESWRMFRYQGGKNTELTGNSTIDIGKGYWLISSEGATIDSGSGTTYNGSLDNPASLSVTTGWNQVGNPYTFNLTWQTVVAANSSLTPGNLRAFSGGSFTNSSTLKVGEGGFVMVQSSGSLTFPMIKNSSGGRMGESLVKQNSIDSDDWEVLLKIKNGELMNDLGGIGMHRDAELMNDRFDDFTLPRFFDYLELNHRKNFINIPISKDIVPVQENYTWEFTIESSLSDKVVEMAWDNSYLGANDKQLVLWDESRQFAVDMRTHASYQFNRSQSSGFKVYFGRDEYIKEMISSDGVVFHDIFPNPAKSNATFAFSLPNSEKAHSIAIDIYDLMGKRVGTVTEGNYSAGYHEVSWDIQIHPSLSGGMYLAKLREGRVVKTKKLIIQQ